MKQYLSEGWKTDTRLTIRPANKRMESEMIRIYPIKGDNPDPLSNALRQAVTRTAPSPEKKTEDFVYEISV